MYMYLPKVWAIRFLSHLKNLGQRKRKQKFSWLQYKTFKLRLHIQHTLLLCGCYGNFAMRITCISACRFFSIRDRFFSISFLRTSLCLKSVPWSLATIVRFSFSSSSSWRLTFRSSSFSFLSIFSTINFRTWPQAARLKHQTFPHHTKSSSANIFHYHFNVHVHCCQVWWFFLNLYLNFHDLHVANTTKHTSSRLHILLKYIPANDLPSRKSIA